MIYSKLKNQTSLEGEREFIVQGDKKYTYNQTLTKVSILKANLSSELSQIENPFILIQLDNSFELIATLFAVDAIKGDLCIASYDFNETEMTDIINRFKFKFLITNKNYTKLEEVKIIHPDILFKDIKTSLPEKNQIDSKNLNETKIIILTTGTTGVPKGAIYSWEDLSKQIAISKSLDFSRWLLVYKLNHFAAIQVFLTALFNNGSLVLLEDWDPNNVVRLLEIQKPEYISATPTFWRMVLPLIEKHNIDVSFIKHITIGGEAVTSDILSKIEKLMPNISIVQVFATTEVGPVFSVKDFQIGFPFDFVRNPQKHGLRAELKIIDDELYVKTKYHMKKYYNREGNPIEDGWCPTDDIVKVEGDRVYFMGRKTETINVGGVKVHPLEVEEIIQSIKGVFMAKVSGRKNPITGQLVVAEVVLKEGFSEEDIRKKIIEECSSKLSRQKVPKIIKFTKTIDTSNLKVIRRAD
jgi:acyl-CoA synthetase (AMP-forming)/AMP-acid ligase II